LQSVRNDFLERSIFRTVPGCCGRSISFPSLVQIGGPTGILNDCHLRFWLTSGMEIGDPTSECDFRSEIDVVGGSWTQCGQHIFLAWNAIEEVDIVLRRAQINRQVGCM